MATDSVVDERTLPGTLPRRLRDRRHRGPSRDHHHQLQHGGQRQRANENEHLLKEILRDTWGFDGAVVTDWGGSNDHALGVKNSSTLEMPAPVSTRCGNWFKAVKDGKISEADINARLRRTADPGGFHLQGAGKGSPRPSTGTLPMPWPARRRPGKHRPAQEQGRPAAPLRPEARIAVIGGFAQTPRYQGAGSSMVNAPKVDSFLQMFEQSGLKSVGFAKGFDPSRQSGRRTAGRGRQAGRKGRHRSAVPRPRRGQGE